MIRPTTGNQRRIDGERRSIQQNFIRDERNNG